MTGGEGFTKLQRPSSIALKECGPWKTLWITCGILVEYLKHPVEFRWIRFGRLWECPWKSGGNHAVWKKLYKNEVHFAVRARVFAERIAS